MENYLQNHVQTLLMLDTTTYSMHDSVNQGGISHGNSTNGVMSPNTLLYTINGAYLIFLSIKQQRKSCHPPLLWTLQEHHLKTSDVESSNSEIGSRIFYTSYLMLSSEVQGPNSQIGSRNNSGFGVFWTIPFMLSLKSEVRTQKSEPNSKSEIGKSDSYMTTIQLSLPLNPDSKKSRIRNQTVLKRSTLSFLWWPMLDFFNWSSIHQRNLIIRHASITHPNPTVIVLPIF